MPLDAHYLAGFEREKEIDRKEERRRGGRGVKEASAAAAAAAAQLQGPASLAFARIFLLPFQ